MEGLACVELGEQGFQLFVGDVRFLQPNSHRFGAISTKMNHELLCSDPFIPLSLPLIRYLTAVADCQLRKNGVHRVCGEYSCHRLYIFQCSMSCRKGELTLLINTILYHCMSLQETIYRTGFPGLISFSLELTKFRILDCCPSQATRYAFHFLQNFSCLPFWHRTEYQHNASQLY